MKRFMLGLGVVLMCAGLLATASAADVPFQVEICQVELGTYRVRVEATGNEPVYVGMVLDWNAYVDWAENDFWVYRDQPIETVISASENSELIFFWIPEDIWVGAYQFYLNADIPLCPVEPGCDQFMPVGPLVTFASTTPLLWAPDDTALTGYSILAGQTAQMIRSQGQYGQIVWACDVLYVRIEAVTGEAIWQADD